MGAQESLARWGGPATSGYQVLSTVPSQVSELKGDVRPSPVQRTHRVCDWCVDGLTIPMSSSLFLS